MEIQNQEISTKLDSLSYENERITTDINYLQKELEEYKRLESINMEKFNSMNNLLQEIKITLHSFFSISKVFVQKFYTITNEDLSHGFSRGFSEIIDKNAQLSCFLPSESNSLEIIKHLEELLRYFGTELEVK